MMNPDFYVSEPKAVTYRGYRYVVSYKHPDFTVVARRYFKELEDAEEFVRSEKEVQASAANIKQSASDILEYRQASRIVIERGLTLEEVVNLFLGVQLKLDKLDEAKTLGRAMSEYVAWRKDNNVSIKLSEAINKYLNEYLPRRGKTASLGACRYQLERMLETLGDMPLVRLTSGKVEGYITHMENRSHGVARSRPRGQYASLRTQHVVLHVIHAFLAFCKKSGYISKNCADGVILPALPSNDPKAYSPEDIAYAISLFDDDKYTKLYVCMAAFTGIRPAELGRLRWRDIKIPDKVIFLSSLKTKTRVRRAVKIPDNLMEWLAEWQPMFGTDEMIFPDLAQYQWRFLSKFRKGRKVIFDGLRHSCASYLLALTGNSSVTAEQLGHSVKILKTHYMDLVHKEDAERFFNITPSTIKQYLDNGK